MSIDLGKRTESAQVSLVKKMEEAANRGLDVDDLSAQVILVMDFSLSMQERYRNGEVQDIAERTLALSLSGLDDDGDVPIHFFHNKVVGSIVVNKDNYSGAVESFARNYSMGGTSYAPAIKLVTDDAEVKKSGFFSRKQEGKPVPTLVFFVTDGEPQDKELTIRLLTEAADTPIFWQFLGVGYSPKFLSQLDTMEGRVLDNVGLTEMIKTTDLSDDQYFDTVLDEFVTQWIPAARGLGIV